MRHVGWRAVKHARELHTSSVFDNLRRRSVALGSDTSDGVLTMYVCGPTVYDAAHLGHARTYVQFDAIRRILRDVHGFHVVNFVNVTDVDDKILDRAEQQGVDWRHLSERFEREFMEDLADLGVEPAAFSPRATDYVDHIVDHISKLVKEGVAYQGKETGSVYFDTLQYNNLDNVSESQSYGALDPSRRSSSAPPLKSDVEDGAEKTEKRRPQDFALWKCVLDPKAAERCSWPSPWGPGRPGWHSECTAMVNATAGTVRGDGRLDIHGGGIDLRFPHHENERVQGQSCCGSEHWTSIFMHTGHLHIHGRKMSKSLKNFVTIKDVLSGASESAGLPRLTPRQLRLLFLGTRYNDPMELSKPIMIEAQQLDTFVSEFYQTLDVRGAFGPNADPRGSVWGPLDAEVARDTATFRKKCHEALCADFDTPKALRLAREFVSKVNVYSRSDSPKRGVLRGAAKEVTRCFESLGIGGATGVPDFQPGGAETRDEQAANVGAVMDVLAEFRSKVRTAALAKDPNAILQLCDELRETKVRALGFAFVDDKTSHEKLWVEKAAPTGPSDVERRTTEAVGQATKSERETCEVEPREFFRGMIEKYSKFTEDGIPTHDAQGSELSKSARKKLTKRMKGLLAVAERRKKSR